MPLLCISTNTTIDEPKALAIKASSLVASQLGKPESYVMVKIEPCDALTFAGNTDPAAHLKLKSLGLSTDSTNALSAALCHFINNELGINSNRIYIEFANPERAMWGWDGRTFA